MRKREEEKKKRGEFFCLLFYGAKVGGAAKLSAELALYLIRLVLLCNNASLGVWTCGGLQELLLPVTTPVASLPTVLSSFECSARSDILCPPVAHDDGHSFCRAE